ncbi:hypothetical protein G6514_001407 [Epicoccum nigrum]|nr:hypothetical protein G6514_001407 [Epicoccum nigrum]
MSLHTALARIELEYLSDVDRVNAVVVRDVDYISTLQEDGIGGVFEKSLRVKGMIDELEALAEQQPSWKTLAALIRSEYRLWHMNELTPLRQNPFLSHWVEAIQRLEMAARVKDEVEAEEVSAQDIAATRLEMIKRMLISPVASGNLTPRQVYEARFPGTPFDVQPCIRVLEEEGIYEPAPAPPVPIVKKKSSTASPELDGPEPNDGVEEESSTYVKEERSDSPRLTFNEWRLNLLAIIATSPDLVKHQLTRLPIALPALDFLTELITRDNLSDHAIDSKEVVLQFTQHALRLIEHIGQPPHPTSPCPAVTDIGLPIDDAHGREAQTRALRLLVLFLRNLVKKGEVAVHLVPGERCSLYWDLEGMYRSYMWMREVREFKAMIEEMDETDVEEGPQVMFEQRGEGRDEGG